MAKRAWQIRARTKATQEHTSRCPTGVRVVGLAAIARPTRSAKSIGELIGRLTKNGVCRFVQGATGR